MNIPADLTISIADIRAAGHCARLAKFFRDNNLRSEYAGMIKGGEISARQLAGTNDPRAVRVVRLKLERGNG